MNALDEFLGEDVNEASILVQPSAARPQNAPQPDRWALSQRAVPTAGACPRMDRAEDSEPSPLKRDLENEYSPKFGPDRNPPIWNNGEPQYTNKREKYEHRVIAFLKAQAHSDVEIARITGYHPVTIRYLIKQKFMEDMILQIIHERGGEAVEVILQSAALDSVKKLIEIRDSDTYIKHHETSRKAANDLLDRVFGKPNQPITHISTDNVNEMSDQEIDQRLAELKAKRQHAQN